MTRAMTLIPSYGTVVSTRVLPRTMLPLVRVATEGINFVVALPLLAIPMAMYSIGPTWSLLWLPVVIAVLVLLVAGPTYICAIFGLYFPDYRGAAQSLIRIGFFASTALVTARKVPGPNLRRLLLLNPVSGIFDSFRDVVIGGHAPKFSHLLDPILAGLILLAAGVALYRWREFEFAKEV
jgi:ABC-type polysaccharide/polyol phosphate export permease